MNILSFEFLYKIWQVLYIVLLILNKWYFVCKFLAFSNVSMNSILMSCLNICMFLLLLVFSSKKSVCYIITVFCKWSHKDPVQTRCSIQLETVLCGLLSLQVFNKLLSLASTASSQKFQSHMWSQMLVSTYGFLKSISNVSGKDIQPLIKQWVYPF